MKEDNGILKEEKHSLRREIRHRLAGLADEGYKEFHGGLVPGQETILGVRVPKMRALAKNIAKKGVILSDSEGNVSLFTWRQYLEAAGQADRRLPSYPCYEEVLLQGLVIGSAAMDFPEFLDRVADFVPKIDNWAVCDVFCGTLKAVKKHTGEMWDFLLGYLALGGDPNGTSSDCPDTEFPLRFAVVMLLSYYIKEDYIDRVLERLDLVRHEGYYVKMAVAWALSICFIKFPDKTMALLQQNHLDDFTYNKAIQKTTESSRVDKETKDILRSMKRK